MMNCKDIEKITDDYLNGELSQAEAAAYAAHLRDCLTCKRKTAVVEDLLMTIRELPQAVPDNSLVRKTRARVYNYHKTSLAGFFDFWADHSRGVFNFAFAAALLIMLALNLDLYHSQKNFYSANIPKPGALNSGNGMQTVRFVFDVGSAEQFSGVSTIAVVGDFNGWNPASNKMRFDNNKGAWVLDLSLKQGIYDYMYVINDKVWIPDPKAKKIRDDGFGGKNSILEL